MDLNEEALMHASLYLSPQVLGRHGHLVQVNAAGRQVAADRGWAMVDFEAMALWYVQPKVCITR